MNLPFFPLFLFITILIHFDNLICQARDSIDVNYPLSVGETLVSPGEKFELGFFTPQGNANNNSYVGIWYYNLIPETIVWVANRDNPILSDGGVFGIGHDGNLWIWLANTTTSVFSIVVSPDNSPSSNTTLRLLDSGNLVLTDVLSRKILWQSFDYPTDTFLPGMKFSSDINLTSWISTGDPASGEYKFIQDGLVYKILKGSSIYWISDESHKFFKILGVKEIPSFVNQLLFNQTARSFGRMPTMPLQYNDRILINSNGEIQYWQYSLNKLGWELIWYEPKNVCALYDKCGQYSICNAVNMDFREVCNCLDGFKQLHSEGCDREESKTCSEHFTSVSLVKSKSPDYSYEAGQNETECKRQCLESCNCIAYSFIFSVPDKDSNETCWIWNSDLSDLRQDYNRTTFNLSVRVPLNLPHKAPSNSGVSPKNKSPKIRTSEIAIIVSIVGFLLVLCSICILYRSKMTKRNGNRGIRRDNPMLFSNENEEPIEDFLDENDKGIDVPFYDLDTILLATNNFSDENKLGQGGFGPVYKGKLLAGNEIAVKRLSSCSSQGFKEFRNEVILIAKLQHRNLVRLLGYCMKQNEKILLYEYMPNKSLDAFLFDQKKCVLLNWEKRFDIILGIARGLIYLHQDSRLRIIHRDLKTSNILLDEDMNPKISDFGLARIVEGKGTEANTNKIVGTFGYMSPEYAMEGKFSIKSDVFSFGVVLLEIISGKKNSGFYQPKEVLNLLGYAWRLWCEHKAMDLADPTIQQSCDKPQVLRCVNVGLLCVQEDPDDRPTMSNVVVMLGSETTALIPRPTRPAFVIRKRVSSSTGPSSSSTKPDIISENEFTITTAEGR